LISRGPIAVRSVVRHDLTLRFGARQRATSPAAQEPAFKSSCAEHHHRIPVFLQTTHNMHRSSVLSALVLNAALTFPASAAEAVRPVDPSSFDIAGVQLGMSLDEAIEASTKSLGVSKREVKKTTLVANPVTSKVEVTKFQILTSTSNLIVDLVPRVPKDAARPTVVLNIFYAMPNTPENRTAMRQAAKDKYGQPSNGSAAYIWEWCESPGRFLGESCTSLEGARMKLDGNNLFLYDNKYKTAYEAFERSLKSGKPGF
jgi:hypothetical protein